MFTIFTMVYNEYEQLRQFIESIFNNIDRESYSNILILDDHSETNGKLREYENYLEETFQFIKVIKFDEYRRIHHYSDSLMERGFVGKNFNAGAFDTKEANLGIVKAFHLGVSQIETEYTFFCHVDTFFTEKARHILSDSRRLFESHPKCRGMGQLWGVEEETKPIEYFEPFTFFYKRDNHDVPHGALIASIFGMFKTESLNEIRIAKSDRPGNTFTHWSREAFKKGYSIINFPCFTKLEIIHLGRGIVRRLTSEEDFDIGFTFCKDLPYHRVCGPRKTEGNKTELLNRLYGRGFINMNYKDYKKYLKETYSKPFEKIQPTLSMDKIYTIE